ncbi:MAG: hypothetical protein ACR2LH_04050 [Thermoleophilaceae bacterium]
MALVIAIIVLGLMMGLGLATASYVDGEQSQSGRERIRESAFNIAESALDAQVLRLTQAWPEATGVGAYPLSCTPAAAASVLCPDTGSLEESAKTADYSSSACPTGSAAPLWTTSVHDDGLPPADYYDAQIVNAQPTYDANGNGRLWVRASGTARCTQRTVITMVNQEATSLGFPRNVVTANWFATSNNGNKVIVDTQGSSAQPAGLVARCIAPFPSPCMKFRPGQVSPPTAESSPSSPPTAMSPVDLAAFKSRAMALNTYYPAGAACPSSLTGPAVYVEDFTGCGGAAANSEAAPGALYIARGTFSLGGNSVFYGLLYMGNLQGSSGAVVTIGGTALIQGAVAIDGPGGLVAGSSKANVIFDERVFDAFQGNARAVRTPSTWRELPRGQ